MHSSPQATKKSKGSHPFLLFLGCVVQALALAGENSAAGSGAVQGTAGTGRQGAPHRAPDAATPTPVPYSARRRVDLFTHRPSDEPGLKWLGVLGSFNAPRARSEKPGKERGGGLH